MKTIKTIDLWTEQYPNHYECFNGAFVDGVTIDYVPFDEYKIVNNCNCIITVDNPNIKITNRHKAIVFYNKGIPVRLVVINKETDVQNCITIALNQYYQNKVLKDIYDNFEVKTSIIDMHESPIESKINENEEIDVGSCDRWALLYNMLKGSYTESDTVYGNFESDRYEFIPNLNIIYRLTTNTEEIIIEHKCAFINALKTRLIPIQENSRLTTERCDY